MVNKICDVAISMSESAIDEMSWSSFVCSIEEPEVPQYYIEESHDAIISPEEFEEVQAEISRRKKLQR